MAILTTRHPGRPKPSEIGAHDARSALIDSARLCFSTHPYAKVTTRMLATQAGVNAALIRYYFLNKEGLYQQMLESVAALFQRKVMEYFEASPSHPFEAIFRAHRAMASDSPDIPKLIFKELAFDEGKSRKLVLDCVAKPNKAFMLALLQKFKGSQHDDLPTLREDFDPSILLLSVLSMSLMPLLLQEAIAEVDGTTFNQEHIEKMIWQNTQMIQFGCLAKGEDT